ncbi:uncharacterized protein M421DRAFT_9857 [Didymella exigua CBS 183.55]|uniref:Uncharacterized protein n=1 Tax=Didymella exigua CBS 183.55 TaxID=1150837 RepID=A0A6A5R6L0_9PLEO|nr:uncharacterized protein M421DRAFT_9857 [Didymella exigua CBS 183.55]KAF1923213.1 hypothetical protein M421DRAFT_9857 [Didymella exigua CBS 183.55]
MAGRGEYQKQLAALWAKAKTHNLEFKDILPKDMEEELLQIKELKDSRELIQGFQEREGQLRAANEALNKDLIEKQSEIDNLPAEYQSTKMDLKQAHRQIDNHKDTIADLNERIERYRAQAKGIVAVKQADAAATEKLKNLQMEVEDQQIIIDSLEEDNRKSVAIFEQLREADAKALKRKDNLLAKKDKELAAKKDSIVKKEVMITNLRQQAHKTHNIDVAQGNTAFASSDADYGAETPVDTSQDDLLVTKEENINLLQRNLELSVQNRALEEQHVQMKTQLYEALASHESSDRNFAAIVSETKTLFRFYQASSQVLDLFANSFLASKASIPSLVLIESQLDAAQEALSGYFEVKKVVRAINSQPDNNNLDRTALYKELDSLAMSASDSAISLETLHSGLWSFLNQLSHDPKLLSDLNAAIELAMMASRLSQVEYCSKP